MVIEEYRLTNLPLDNASFLGRCWLEITTLEETPKVRRVTLCRP